MLFQIYIFRDLLIKLLVIFDYIYQEYFIILQIFYGESEEILEDLFRIFLKLTKTSLDHKLETINQYFL